MERDMVDAITAIAGLWKLVLAITAFAAIFIFKAPFQQMIEKAKNLRFKRGQTEVSVEKEPSSEKTENTPVPDAKIAQAPVKQEPQQESTSLGPEGLLFEMYLAFYGKEILEAEEKFKLLQESESSQDAKVKNEVIYLVPDRKPHILRVIFGGLVMWGSEQGSFCARA